MTATRVAVLGLYRSGSSAAAGVLHHLGVDLGSPFHESYYESESLARRLRRWWHEPDIQENYPRRERVRKLGDWIARLEAGGASHVGAKHPLLSLCGDDLVAAWGPSTRFVWTHRPVADSIASIRRTHWWPEPWGERMQMRLWEDVNRFFACREHLRIDFADLLADPAREIGRMVSYLDLTPSAERLSAALTSVRQGESLAPSDGPRGPRGPRGPVP